MQIWVAEDFDHRLSPARFLDIINLSNTIIKDEDLEIEIEYQNDTIGKYNLGFDNGNFELLATQTDCLAKDNCGIPEVQEETKTKFDLSDLTAAASNNSCAPGSGCC